MAAPVIAALLALGLALGVAPGGASAQPIVVVDMARVLREAEVARALRGLQEADRRALRAELDALQRELEAREAELSELRATAARADFEDLVRAFDQRVRRARRDAQAASEALQERYAAAGRALREAIDPALDAVMAERGAALALDRDAALRASASLDVTDAVIATLDARRPAESARALLPSPPQPMPPTPRPETGLGPADPSARP